MGLNANQKQAVEYLEGPLLVLAGPGTGKTQLLSCKVAYILENTDTNPENILCLTFTDVGAKNMRERLKTMIGKDALKVNIGTYHAFGSEILGQYKWYAEDFDRKLEKSIDEVTQYKIVKKIQDKLSGTDILRGDAVKDIISVISEAKAARLTPENLLMIAEQNIADSKVLSEAISPLLLNIVPRKFQESYEGAYRPIYEILKDYLELAPILGTVERTITGMARDLAAAITEANGEKIKPLTAWKDAYFEKDERGEYRLKDRVRNLKLKSIAQVMAKYEEYLEENGLFDYDDMIEEAGKILERDDGFRMTLQEKYQFIMLDEFQDTNPSQFTIVKKLTEYENPLIMAVGDDDQAIYEFQGAKASNLTDFKEYYGAKVVPLTENYRSTQEILDFSRQIINQAPDRFMDKELVAHKGNPARSQIRRYEFLSSDAEYGFIAKKIAELVKAGEKQSEIAVISYKTKYFEPLIPYLKAYPELKIAYEKRDNLLEDEKIHEILSLARFVDEIGNGKPISVPLMEIFTYSCLDLPVMKMLNITEVARKSRRKVIEVMLESEDTKVKETAEWFLELMKEMFSQPLEMILGKFVEKIEPTLKDEYQRFRFYENLAALMGKVMRHCGERTLKLADLIEMIDDLEAAGMSLNVASPYREADEAIQILSAHKAKGLEFKHVFIISADHRAWGKGKGNNDMLALPKNLMQIRHTGTTDSEKLRILYVALTRAKEALYISNALSDFNGKAPDRLGYLQEYAEGDEVISPFLPDGKVELKYEVDVPETEQNLKNWLTVYVKESPDMRALYRERLKDFRMSPSALASFVDLAYGGPEEFFKQYILRVPGEPENEAMLFGNLVHATFEAITKGEISEEQAIEFYIDKLEERNLEADLTERLREKGVESLTASLAKFGEILKTGEAEVDFRPEKIMVGNVPVTGKIDHLVINETDKTIEVYDFKTGKYHKNKWDGDLSSFKYMIQLGFYKLLLNRSKKYGKYRVLRGHILYVAPDQDGVVYDKVYDYNKEDEERLVRLLQVVYGKVESLEFLDDPEIFRGKDMSLGIKDVKEFVKMLVEERL